MLADEGGKKVKDYFASGNSILHCITLDPAVRTARDPGQEERPVAGAAGASGSGD